MNASIRFHLNKKFVSIKILCHGYGFCTIDPLQDIWGISLHENTKQSFTAVKINQTKMDDVLLPQQIVSLKMIADNYFIEVTISQVFCTKIGISGRHCYKAESRSNFGHFDYFANRLGSQGSLSIVQSSEGRGFESAWSSNIIVLHLLVLFVMRRKNGNNSAALILTEMPDHFLETSQKGLADAYFPQSYQCNAALSRAKPGTSTSL